MNDNENTHLLPTHISPPTRQQPSQETDILWAHDEVYEILRKISYIDQRSTCFVVICVVLTFLTSTVLGTGAAPTDSADLFILSWTIARLILFGLVVVLSTFSIVEAKYMVLHTILMVAGLVMPGFYCDPNADIVLVSVASCILLLDFLRVVYYYCCYRLQHIRHASPLPPQRPETTIATADLPSIDTGYTILTRPTLSYVTFGSDSISNMCIICRADFTLGEPIAMLSCKHSYHGTCILEWTQRNNICPVCRQHACNSINMQ